MQRRARAHRKTRASTPAILAALAFLTFGHSAAAQGQERYELSGNNIAVYNLAGNITIERGSGSAVVVEVTLNGPDATRLAVETGELGGRNTLRVRYPMERIIYADMRGSRTQLRYRPDGTFGDDRRRRRSRRITISGSGRGVEASADLTIKVPEGKRLNVHLAVGEVEVTGTDGTLYIDTHQAPVTASDVSGLLNIDVGSGSVEVSNVRGPVEIDTGSGSVIARRVSGDRLLVDTGSGSVRASDVSAPEINIDTGSGSVTLTNATADDIVIDTGSGGVSVDLTSDVRKLLVDTGSGSVRITVPENVGGELEIDTGSGGIEVDFPLQITKWERTYVHGTLGDGKGRIVIDTGSGSVTLTRR